MLRIAIVSLLLTSTLCSAQLPQYPKGYFRWPVNLKPDIVANLGEMRPNHWHMGFDVRTGGKENQQVFAAAAGYIAFIGIRPQSFGRFIIINHPNGLSTLYGHLNDFAPEIEAWVTSQQYAKESWPMELELQPTQFPVNKGSFIAYSGNTGGSQGPHVHFEIRDTRSNQCLNLSLFGFPLADNVPPSIVKVALYDRGASIYNSPPKFFAAKKNADGYGLTQPLVRTGASRLSFGIQAFDRRTGSQNQDGIYAANVFVDDVLQINYTIDSIGYDKTSYLNAHIDYLLKSNGGPFIQLLTNLPGNRAGEYHPASSDGVIHLDDTTLHKVRIEVLDGYLNKTTLAFQLKYDASIARPVYPVATGGIFIPNQVNTVSKTDFEATLPETAIYDTVQAFYFKSLPGSVNAVSAIHQLNEAVIPVQGSYQVRIRPDRPIRPDWLSKLVIERTFRGSRQVRKAELLNGWLTASFSDFGFFAAYTDLQPPTIHDIGKGDTVNLSAAKRIVLTPTDNFGIKSFRATLDGQWLRFTNDKGRSWIYQFDERCADGVHQLEVTVEDIVGNVTVRSWWFKKYPYTAPVKKKSSSKKGSGKTVKANKAVKKKK